VETFHTTRVLGPYESDARIDAANMAGIQTDAWAGWLAEHGLSREVVQATLESDSQNQQHIDNREERLSQSLRRNSSNEAVLYMGSFATSGDMVGFAKFLLHREEDRLVIMLAEMDVLPEYQGKQSFDPTNHNMAKKMIYSALAQVRGRDALLRLSVLASNARARALYEHLGLQVIDSSESFEFEDQTGAVVHSEPHLVMEGSAVMARDLLRVELAV